jgi:Tol biopolymer transport system component
VIDEREIVRRAVERLEPPEPSFERLIRRLDRKRRNQRIAAGVVGIAVFVSAIWIVTSVGSVDRTQTPAVPGGAETGPTPTPPAGIRVPYLVDLNTGEQTPLPTSIAGGLGFSVSPDGTMVAYLSEDEGKGQVFIASMDGTDVQQVTHTRRWAVFPDMPDWSPDGAAIAYVPDLNDVPRNILVLDLATGETSQVTNEKPPGLGALFPRFSPDGASIVYWVMSIDGPSVRSVPVTGGKSTLLVGGGKNDVEASFPTFSPDGSALAVGCSGPGLEGICIADADGTNLRELVSGPPVFGPEWSPDGTRIAYTHAHTPIRATDNPRVFVVDVATGETTFVDEGIVDDWLDDHTLIIERTE